MKKKLFFLLFAYYILGAVYPLSALAQIPINEPGEITPVQEEILKSVQSGARFLDNPQALQAVLPHSMQQTTGLFSFLEKVKDIPIIGGSLSGILSKIFPATRLWQATTVQGQGFDSFQKINSFSLTDLWSSTFGEKGFANFVRISKINLPGNTDDEKFKASIQFIQDSLIPIGISR